MNTGRYTIDVRRVQRELERLRVGNRALWEDVIAAVRELETTPRPDGVVKLQGNLDGYRIRVRGFRVLYDIDDNARMIVVTNVSKRGDAY